MTTEKQLLRIENEIEFETQLVMGLFVPLDAHSGARHRGEHEFVDLNIWGRIMASVELWYNFTFESQYQLLHGKFSQYPKEVQVEKTENDFI